MPLNQLQRIIESTSTDGIQISRLPNAQEMMDKINEIVRFVNQLELQKANEPEENPFMPKRLR